MYKYCQKTENFDTYDVDEKATVEQSKLALWWIKFKRNFRFPKMYQTWDRIRDPDRHQSTGFFSRKCSGGSRKAASLSLSNSCTVSSISSNLRLSIANNSLTMIGPSLLPPLPVLLLPQLLQLPQPLQLLLQLLPLLLLLPQPLLLLLLLLPLLLLLLLLLPLLLLFTPLANCCCWCLFCSAAKTSRTARQYASRLIRPGHRTAFPIRNHLTRIRIMSSKFNKNLKLHTKDQCFGSGSGLD